MRLTYIRENQFQDDEDEEFIGTGDAEPIGNICLPSTFIHSPAWSAANVSDCLALRKALGPITLFITFTTNPTWSDIVSQLLSGQCASDRPDIIVRVFHQKQALFMKDISNLELWAIAPRGISEFSWSQVRWTFRALYFRQT